jgi:tripartite-type tricarboxylate transporter receptor subunit TctC
MLVPYRTIHRFTNMKNIILTLLTAAITLGSAAAMAQSADVKSRLKALKPADFPVRAIEVGVGSPAGGGMDITARLVAKKFQEYTGENLIINNRPGAGGMVFHRYIVTQAAPDGYSIGVVNNIIIGDSLLRAEDKWSYKDADSLAFINYEPVLWLASTSGRFKDQQLAQIAKASQKDRDEVRVGTIAATFLEMLAEQVEQKAGVTLTKVPFNGGKPSVAALMGDHIDISFGFVGEVKGLGDRVKPIAVASPEPVAALPNVPTFNMVFGSKDMNWMIWRYVIAPKGVPSDRRTWLVAAFNEVLKDPQLIAELDQLGGIADPSLNTPEKVAAELDRLAQAERAFYVQTGRLK